MSPTDFYIDSELIKKVPTEMLIVELKRRTAEFFGACTQLLENSPQALADLKQTMAMPGFEVPAPIQAEEASFPTAYFPHEPETGLVTQGATELVTPEGRFGKAAEAGLSIPRKLTDADLPANLLVVQEQFKTDVMKDPARMASMRAAVRTQYGGPGATALRNELLATGRGDLVQEMDRAASLQVSSSMRAPGIAAIVAANKRNAADAFIQPILPPSIKGGTQAPTETGKAWFDNPAVVTIDLMSLLVNSAPARPGIPATPSYELSRRTDDFLKTLKGVLATLKTDGCTGHLPSPVARIDGYELQLLLEPVVIYRLLLHLCPRVPYVHVATNLRDTLNTFIEANVVEEERLLLTGGADTMAVTFKEVMTSQLQRWQRAASSAKLAKLARGLGRQVRIFNPEFQERDIPDEMTADRMKLSDPRTLWGDMKQGPGADAGMVHLPSNEARKNALRGLRGNARLPGQEEPPTAEEIDMAEDLSSGEVEP